MAIRLSSTDLTALQHASTVLLSPFAYDNSESWRLAIGEAVEHCIGGDGSAFALPVSGEQYLAGKPHVLAGYQKLVPPPDWIVRGLTLRRRQLGLTAFGWDDVFDIDAVRKTSFYNDVARPHGILAPLMMSADTGESAVPATLSISFTDERKAQRHAHRRKEILRLLAPAFCTGLKTFIGFRRNTAALTALAQDAAIGVLFFDTRSLPSRENDFFRRLMECEPERDRVRSEVAHVVRGIVAFPAFDGLPTGKRQARSEIQTSAARYRLAATFFGDQSSPRSGKAIALVERIERRPIDARDLDSCFALTRREIESAQLLRRGLSSRQIASELGISVNTARRHIESVLLKLDVHTRAAAAAKLSGMAIPDATHQAT
jgi:DNA-binding CsgD family transcriptional regulator